MTAVQPLMTQPKLRFGSEYIFDVSPEQVETLRDTLKREARDQNIKIDTFHRRNLWRTVAYPGADKEPDKLVVSTGKWDRVWSWMSHFDYSVVRTITDFLIKPWAKPMFEKRPAKAENKNPVAEKTKFWGLSVVIAATMAIALIPMNMTYFAIKIPLAMLTVGLARMFDAHKANHTAETFLERLENKEKFDIAVGKFEGEDGSDEVITVQKDTVTAEKATKKRKKQPTRS
nr:MetaGeneMark_Unknown Function [uncultured bacterium]ALS92446.1 MetaGeneMark_Unknown Function [uncultured bacterium]